MLKTAEVIRLDKSKYSQDSVWGCLSELRITNASLQADIIGPASRC